MLRTRVVHAVLIAAGLVARAAWAQNPDTESLERMRRALGPDQVVLVTDESGTTTRGRIADLSETSLQLLVEPTRKNPSGTLSVPRHSIQRIATPDSDFNGWLVGLAAGLGAHYAFVRANCGPPGYDDECSANVARIGLPIFVPAGAIIGALVDNAIKRTIYSRPSAR
jgi:hypothetical protein